MKRNFREIRIREATVEDAMLLCTWWNDGKIMEHAGFPNGLGITLERVWKLMTEQNEKDCRHIILYADRPIGEMNYREIGEKTCEIGIKICDSSMQNKGLGKIILSLFIDSLFHEYGYQKIVLDTNLNNKRAQHVYEQLGFKKIRVNKNSWKDQLGNMQSSVDYELTRESFISYW